MDTSKIIVVPKMSKYQWDMCRLGLSHEELAAEYSRQGVDAERMLSSHERQMESLRELETFLHETQFVQRDGLTKQLADNASLLISLGGDNHFQYVSRFLGNTPIMGINSDPLRSDGGLTYFTAREFERVLRCLEKDDFSVEGWTRLDASVNGGETCTATSEVYMGESERKNMSRHILEYRGITEEQKCSGLLVATGAGSSGWYSSACRYLHPEGNPFPRTSGYARFLVTEPFRGRLTRYPTPEGVLERGERLAVRSLNDSSGRLMCDSLDEYGFRMGSVAAIGISESPLRVVRL